MYIVITENWNTLHSISLFQEESEALLAFEERGKTLKENFLREDEYLFPNDWEFSLKFYEKEISEPSRSIVRRTEFVRAEKAAITLLELDDKETFINFFWG